MSGDDGEGGGKGGDDGGDEDAGQDDGAEEEEDDDEDEDEDEDDVVVSKKRRKSAVSLELDEDDYALVEENTGVAMQVRERERSHMPAPVSARRLLDDASPSPC